MTEWVRRSPGRRPEDRWRHTIRHVLSWKNLLIVPAAIVAAIVFLSFQPEHPRLVLPPVPSTSVTSTTIDPTRAILEARIAALQTELDGTRTSDSVERHALQIEIDALQVELRTLSTSTTRAATTTTRPPTSTSVPPPPTTSTTRPPPTTTTTRCRIFPPVC